MKFVVITLLLIFPLFNLFAQKMQHISFDVKATDGYVENVTPIKGKGAIVEIRNKKPLGVDLVFYDMNMDKKWTCSFTKDDLHMAAGIQNSAKDALGMMKSYIYYVNNEIVYVNNLSYNNKKEGLTIFIISMDGKVEQRSANPTGRTYILEDVFDGAVIAGDNIYVLRTGKFQYESKPRYEMRKVNLKDATLGDPITLHVPVLKDGIWTYGGCDKSKLYFYGIEEATEKNNKANGFDVVVAPVTLSGDLVQPFDCNVRLDTYYPSPESQASPALYVQIDTPSNALFVYCNMAATISYIWVGANRCKGMYIQKYDLNGNLKWSKQYTNEEIAAFNNVFKVKDEPVSYSSYINIDDSTHDIVLVRDELAGMKLYMNERCFLFDSDGNLKKAFMGGDQSGKMGGNNTIGTSAFFTCYPYKQGDPSYLEKLHQIFAPYPQGKDRPAAKIMNMGSKYWVEVIDKDKNTFDIYQL